MYCYTERAKTAAVSRGTNHVATRGVSTPLGWIFKLAKKIKKKKKKSDSHSFRITCKKSAFSLLEGGELRHIKAINNNNRERDRQTERQTDRERDRDRETRQRERRSPVPAYVWNTVHVHSCLLQS